MIFARAKHGEQVEIGEDKHRSIDADSIESETVSEQAMMEQVLPATTDGSQCTDELEAAAAAAADDDEVRNLLATRHEAQTMLSVGRFCLVESVDVEADCDNPTGTMAWSTATTTSDSVTATAAAAAAAATTAAAASKLTSAASVEAFRSVHKRRGFELVDNRNNIGSCCSSSLLQRPKLDFRKMQVSCSFRMFI